MKSGLIGAAAAVVVILLGIPGLLFGGAFGLLTQLVAEVQENGPKLPPEIEAAYRQVAAERGRDWAMLAAWDAADNEFNLPVRPESDIYDDLVRRAERRRQEEADRYCQTLPPEAECPDPEPLTEEDLARLAREAHRIWYTSVLDHIRSHADQITEAAQLDPEPFFQTVLEADKAAQAAELHIGYAALDQLADDDHVIEVPGGTGPPPDWQPVDGFAWPASGPITSRYGMRQSPIDGQWRLHAGIDLGIDEGTPIRASKAGTVVRAEWDNVFGNVVVVDHGDGYRSLYAHNSSLLVTAGTGVEQGQVLSLAGSTGWSTGPHLHFEIHFSGGPVDPLLLLGR